MLKFDRWMQVLEEAALEGGGGGGGSDALGAGGDVASTIQESIAGLEGSETPPPAADPAPDAEEAELGKLEKEWQAQNPNAKGNIAIHRHQAVLTRTRNQWATEKQALEAAHKKALDEYGFVKDPQFLQGLQMLMLAEENPEAFVTLLRGDERFKGYLTPQQQAAVKPGEGRPGPNKTAADGTSKFYDEEGLAALMTWERAQAVKEAREEFTKEFGPVKQEYEQRNAWNGALESQRKVLENARTHWHGFKDHEAQIKQALIDHQDWELHDAYRSVVVGKALEDTKVNREKLRAEILAELKQRPAAAASATRPGGGVEKVGGAGEQTTQDIIRASLPKDR